MLVDSNLQARDSPTPADRPRSMRSWSGPSTKADEGSLDETQRARLLEIATRCPVHRKLTSKVKIQTVGV